MLGFAEEITIGIDIVILAAIAGIFIYLSKAYKNYQEYFVLAFIFLIHFTGLNKDILFALTNIIVVVLGIYKIIVGGRKNSYHGTKNGIYLILLIIMFRFISSELSFAAKSILFLITGTLFLLSGKIVKKLGGSTNE